MTDPSSPATSSHDRLDAELETRIEQLGVEGAELSRDTYRFWQQVTAGTRFGS